LSQRRVAILTLFVAMISIQFGASIAKGLFLQVGPEGATALRTLLAALFLGAVFRPWRGPALSARALWLVLAYGAALGTMNLAFYKAIARIPIGVAVAVEFTGPLAVAILSSRRALDALWAGLAIAGILLLLPTSGDRAAYDPIGLAFALGAGLCWALYIVFGKQAGALLGGGRAPALGMFCAAVVTVPFGLAHAGFRIFSGAILPTAALVALLSSALPYTLEMISLKRLPTKTFGVLMSLEPAIAALSGLLLLNEQLAALQWLAIGCVIAASIGSTTTTSVVPAVPEMIA
jgi:inner membrane transporter RhtA